MHQTQNLSLDLHLQEKLTSFVNEYGQKACMVIYGCEILNEGSGFSIDTIISEKACTFVARRLDPMVPVED